MTPAEYQKQDLLDKRLAWLGEMESTERDVIEGEHGEYLMIENEVGTPTETGYSVSMMRVYLPEEYQGIWNR